MTGKGIFLIKHDRKTCCRTNKRYKGEGELKWSCITFERGQGFKTNHTIITLTIEIITVNCLSIFGLLYLYPFLYNKKKYNRTTIREFQCKRTCQRKI